MDERIKDAAADVVQFGKRQGSWISKHPVLTFWISAGAILVLAAVCIAKCHG